MLTGMVLVSSAQKVCRQAVPSEEPLTLYRRLKIWEAELILVPESRCPIQGPDDGGVEHDEKKRRNEAVGEGVDPRPVCMGEDLTSGAEGLTRVAASLIVPHVCPDDQMVRVEPHAACDQSPNDPARAAQGGDSKGPQRAAYDEVPLHCHGDQQPGAEMRADEEEKVVQAADVVAGSQGRDEDIDEIEEKVAEQHPAVQARDGGQVWKAGRAAQARAGQHVHHHGVAKPPDYRQRRGRCDIEEPRCPVLQEDHEILRGQRGLEHGEQTRLHHWRTVHPDETSGVRVRVSYDECRVRASNDLLARLSWHLSVKTSEDHRLLHLWGKGRTLKSQEQSSYFWKHCWQGGNFPSEG